MNPEMTFNTVRWKVPHRHSTNTSQVTNFNLFGYTTSHIWVTGHFGKSVPSYPKWPWTAKMSKVPQICSITTPFNHFTLQLVIFKLLVILRKFTEWPKKSLNTTMSKLLHIHVHVHGICCTCAPNMPKSQTLVPFALRPAVFELQAILRQLRWMTPKWPWTQKGIHHVYT